MENFQIRFPVPFCGQGRGMNSTQFMPQAGRGCGQHRPRPPSGWGGSQVRPHRAPNMIWSDPSLYNHGPSRGTPRPPSPYTSNDSAHPNPYPLQVGPGRGGGRRGKGRGVQRQRGGHSGQGADGNNYGGHKKKEKLDKRDLPENNQFHCEVCDRGFKTEDKYQQHVSEHQQCSVKGCRYVAAPKLVQLHYQTQHKTGVARRVWSLDSSEDIEKWIQDRKRNYPTKGNVARKHQLSTERQARGEVIETKQFGKFRGHGRRKGRFQRWEKGRETGHHQDNPSGMVQKRAFDGSTKTDHDTETASPSCPKKLKLDSSAMGSNNASNETAQTKKLCSEKDTRDPLSFLITDKGCSEEESEASSDSDDARPQLMLRGGLASLISSYDTDEYEKGVDEAPPVESISSEMKGEENGPPEEPAHPSPHLQVATEKISHSQGQISGGHPQPGIGAPFARGQVSQQQQKQVRSLQSQQHGQGKIRNFASTKINRKPTLLERLLASEIRHERNVILQCVHYIVKHGFLGVCDAKVGR